MEVKAEIKYIHATPRKLKLVVDAIRHLPLNRAIEELLLIKKRAAEDVRKALVSARANAVNNHRLKEETLSIKSIEVNGGPVLKRWQPVSRGMAHGYKKRMSHIKVVLHDMVKPAVVKKELVQTLPAPVAKKAKTETLKVTKGGTHGSKNKS